VPSETPQIACRRFVKSLSAWQDGELAEGARASFEAHRAGCTRCARYAAGFGATIALLKSALAESAGHTAFPEDLAQAILYCMSRHELAHIGAHVLLRRKG
jgi:anti-sigma factor RsiW